MTNQGSHASIEQLVEVVQERLASADGRKLVAETTANLETYRATLDARLRIDPSRKTK